MGRVCAYFPYTWLLYLYKYRYTPNDVFTMEDNHESFECCEEKVELYAQHNLVHARFSISKCIQFPFLFLNAPCILNTHLITLIE